MVRTLSSGRAETMSVEEEVSPVAATGHDDRAGPGPQRGPDPAQPARADLYSPRLEEWASYAQKGLSERTEAFTKG